jgi:hypothetical protein
MGGHIQSYRELLNCDCPSHHLWVGHGKPCFTNSPHLWPALKEAVLEWDLEWPGVAIPVTTDNAKNNVKAVSEAGLSPHIGCFAHTINLAAQKATGLSQVSWVLGRVRKVVSSFHRSTTAAEKTWWEGNLLPVMISSTNALYPSFKTLPHVV